MNIKFKKLNNTIIKCKKCPRLVKFGQKISKLKRKQNLKEVYWGKPVTGFGDLNAKLMILGLAPAAHGGTRTGRAFTGDKSGDFLFKCLKIAKISNQSTSTHITDGLRLNKTYITNNCANYFDNEVANLKNLKVIITLGRVSFNSYIKFYKKNYPIIKKVSFKHGKKYILPDGKILIASYHPSPRNVNTKLINLNMMTLLFNKARKLI